MPNMEICLGNEREECTQAKRLLAWFMLLFERACNGCGPRKVACGPNGRGCSRRWMQRDDETGRWLFNRRMKRSVSCAAAGGLRRGRFRWRREAQASGAACKGTLHASTSDSSRMFERSERSERSEFRDA